MSRISKLQKQRLLRQGKRRRRARLPKHYYFDLKRCASTAEFAEQVIILGGVRQAIEASKWFEAVKKEPGFIQSRICETWIRRVSKRWHSQQRKRYKSVSAAKRQTAHEKKSRPPCAPKAKKQHPVQPKFVHIARLLRDNQSFIVASRSLADSMYHQKLLMEHDAAEGKKREELAEKIQAFESMVRAKVFIGQVKAREFRQYRPQDNRLDWKTDFEGAVLEVEFLAKGFKSSWKAKLADIGICNTVKGWQRHFIHRRSRMPARFTVLAARRIKEAGKTHLLRDMKLVDVARLAA